MKRIVIYLKSTKDHRELKSVLAKKGETISSWVRKCSKSLIMWESEKRGLRERGY